MPFLAPVITGIGAILTGASAFLSSGTILAGVARLGLGIAAEYAIGQLVGQPSAPSQATHLQAQYGENLPRTVVLGKRGLAGHFIYRNAFSKGNRRVQDVYVLAHFRINGVTRVRYDGAWKTLGGDEDAEKGFRVQDIDAEIWVKVYEGALGQAADPGLIAQSNPAGRWTAAHRLAGLAYAVVTQQLDQEKLPQPWDAFFEVEGVCYDWRQDDTVGGDGDMRWSDPATWGPSGNPIIQAYNLERGFYLGDQLIVGKGTTSSRLPLANWTLAANISDEAVTSGTRYASSYIASAGQGITHANNMEPILAACAGSWYNGPSGEYPIAGANQAVVATITDADLLVDEDERVALKRTRSELVNTIAGTYYDPVTFYEPLPLATRTDDVAFAADRERLATSIGYEAVTDPAVGDRLNDIALRASRYQGNAEICLRPKFLGLKVGQWIRWQSDKAGGFDKSFQILRRRLGPLGPKACRAVYLTLQEVGEGIFDPTAYETLPPDSVVPGPGDYQSELDDYHLDPIIIQTLTGSQRAAIRASWATIEDITIDRVEFQYRPVDQPDAIMGETATSDQTVLQMVSGVISLSDYEVRYRLQSEPPRTIPWTPWIPVTTLDARLVGTDIYPIDLDQLAQNVRDFQAWTGNAVRDVLDELRAVSASTSADALVGFSDKQTLRREVASRTGDAIALFREEIIVATGPGSSLVTSITTLQTSVSDIATGLVATNSTVLALSSTVTTQGDLITSTNAAITALQNTVNDPATGVAATATAVSSLTTTVTSQGGLITANSSAILALQTSIDDVSASATFRMGTGYTPAAGWSSKIGIEARVTSGGTFRAAGLYFEATTTASRVLIVADQFVVTDGTTRVNPFVVTGGVAYMENVTVGTLKFNQLSSNNGKLVIRGSGTFADLSIFV